MSTKGIVSAVVIVVVVGVAAFFGGLQVGKKSASASTSGDGKLTTTSATGRVAGGNRVGATGTFGGGVTGQIVSADASSITVKTQNGSTEIVYFSSTTPITKQSTASASDLTTGTDVVVRGSSSNGTVTASNIGIVPSLPTLPSDGVGASGSVSANAPMIPYVAK